MNSANSSAASSDLLADTGPPLVAGGARWQRLKDDSLRKISGVLLPMIQRAAREHVGGDTIVDALCVARRASTEGASSTVGFWDTSEYTGRQVADIYLQAIDSLRTSQLDSYISIKPPALRFDAVLAGEVAAAARIARVRLHCDSHGPEVAALSHTMEHDILAALGPESVSTTLPGRWGRSLADANWAVEHGIGVRVVKGQWPDPVDPKRDLRSGFLEVIDRLAGRARHVRVASHDVSLAAEAIRRLRRSGTPCELELLFGMPMKRSLAWAAENKQAVRIYIPFGKGYLPNAVGLLKHNPSLAWRVLCNLLP